MKSYINNNLLKITIYVSRLFILAAGYNCIEISLLALLLTKERGRRVLATGGWF